MNLKRPIVFFALVSLWAIEVADLSGQDESAETSIAAVTEAFELSKKKVRDSTEGERFKLKVGYFEALKRLETELQKEGKLEELLEARKERETLSKTGKLGTSENEELVRLRTIYTEALEPIQAKEAKALAKATGKYQEQLNTLVTTLTKAGKIDDALRAKSMSEQASIDREVLEKGIVKNAVPQASGNEALPMTPSGPAAAARLVSVPKIDPPLVSDDIFSKTEWPVGTAIPEGDYRIRGTIKVPGIKGRELLLTPGSTLRGAGDGPYWFVGNAVTVAKGVSFDGFSFRGDLSSRLYFEDCDFKDMIMGKGGAWGRGRFMSRWQFRNCRIEGSFTDRWLSRHIGVQMLDCQVEDVDFFPVEYHKDDEASEIALNDWQMVLNTHFRKCEIPASVLSLTENCRFEECRFVDDPKTVKFAQKVHRILYVEDCDWRIGTTHPNLTFEQKPLRAAP